MLIWGPVYLLWSPKSPNSSLRAMENSPLTDDFPITLRKKNPITMARSTIFSIGKYPLFRLGDWASIAFQVLVITRGFYFYIKLSWINWSLTIPNPTKVVGLPWSTSTNAPLGIPRFRNEKNRSVSCIFVGYPLVMEVLYGFYMGKSRFYIYRDTPLVMTNRASHGVAYLSWWDNRGYLSYGTMRFSIAMWVLMGITIWLWLTVRHGIDGS